MHSRSSHYPIQNTLGLLILLREAGLPLASTVLWGMGPQLPSSSLP